MIYIGAIIILILMSAFFSGSETALMALSRLRLRRLSQTRPKRAKIVEGVLRNTDKLIGTILLGNNLVNVAMTALATSYAIMLWGEAGIAYVTVFLTILILIFAEITPKVYSKYFNEKVSMAAAPVLALLMTILGPIVAVITWFTNIILRLAGADIRRLTRPLFTEAEIKTAIKMGWEDKAITPDEEKILSRVFMLNDLKVSDIMVERKKMTTLSPDSTIKQTIRKIVKTGYTRFPVEKNGDIIGQVNAKDIFKLPDGEKSGKIGEVLRPAYFVPVDRKIDTQLRDFKRRRQHQAVVLDEEGEVVGLVTLEDVIEELVGNIEDETDMP